MIVGDKAVALSFADLRGIARLVFDATIGVTDLVEQMHSTIGAVAAPLGRPRARRTRGITGFVYRTIRGTARLVSSGVDASMRLLEPRRTEMPVSPGREAALAAVNGLWGDHLEASGNPLAIPMSLRLDGTRIEPAADDLQAALPVATGRIAVLLHGLCMNDLQWQRDGYHHGAMLSKLGYTALPLHYNTGLHVSDNGERFATMLEALVAHWPRPVEELVIVGHSMGGLVARSACHIADTRSLAWRARLTRLVCLGTPHHGAVLERGGYLVDKVLELSPYVAPFARPGKARSAGITDLRFGNVQRADWQGRHPHDQAHDDRTPTPLPAGVRVYLLAATSATQPRGLRHSIIGDGLVTLASAWGEHRDRALALNVPSSHKCLITQASHWDLLSHPKAASALRRWLA
ncbi:MAG: lipase family alpha/beta hydrolase [Gemmatimonadota bacterium]